MRMKAAGYIRVVQLRQYFCSDVPTVCCHVRFQAAEPVYIMHRLFLCPTAAQAERTQTW